jgi:hypothetical protein
VDGHVRVQGDGVFVCLVALGAHVRAVGEVAADVDLQLVHLQQPGSVTRAGEILILENVNLIYLHNDYILIPFM